RLTVTDSTGATNTESQTFVVPPVASEPPPDIPPDIPPNVTFVEPTSGASFPSPANVTITAAASDPDGFILRVEFHAVDLNGNGAPIGYAWYPPFTITWSPEKCGCSTGKLPGTYTVTAIAVDNAQKKASVSMPITLTDPNAEDPVATPIILPV